ncbi:MAG TPA: metal-dependent transcriptional regulator [Candidatus Dormibacteraeota bacterium]|jgi:DtxR family Mn-dependent transcriptional regulator|nr:metal-dependent transcriptional regulator [Candidatus Dormibacteraeota bacterium]
MSVPAPGNDDPAGSPSEVVSRYLEAIYYIWAEGEVVRSSRLADWLGVSRPTVTLALQRMTRDGLVSLNAGKEIRLTESGLSAATTIVRRHRIVERWLTDVLGLDWVDADEEAARLEHSISERVETQLFESLGRPTSCPHGNPIPGHSEPDPNEVRLSEVSTGWKGRVSRISEVAEREAPTLLAYLSEHALVPRALVRVLESDPRRATVTVEVEERSQTLDLDAVAKVWVVPS